MSTFEDGANGYRIDAAFYPWSTPFEEPAERPCSAAYGFETLYVELFAADTGRPVTTAAYELANTLKPKDAFAQLMKQLGKEHGIPGQIAMEQVMACGLGPCYVCVRTFEVNGHKELRRVCIDGPVFDLQEALGW